MHVIVLLQLLKPLEGNPRHQQQSVKCQWPTSFLNQVLNDVAFADFLLQKVCGGME